jgi:hypothetical protein
MAEANTVAAPKVFLSYSWDDEDHKNWTKAFAAQLRADGVDATLDQWAAVPGDRLPHFMEQAIRQNSYVLIICTPKYKEKSNNRVGGVGYEGDIMTGEVHTQGNHRKFIPILRRGERATAMPSWVAGKYDIDLRGDPYSRENYLDLLATLHNQREQAPPVGPAPRSQALRETKKPSPRQQEAVSAFEPIQIVGVLSDEVGEPRNDGTRGSALYSIPFKLNQDPLPEWSRLFVSTWDHPPQWTTSHRPGIAQVHGDKIILTRTTIEEVQKTHRHTLKVVVDKVNQEIAEFIRKRRAADEAKAHQSEQHQENVRRIGGDLKFD